MLCLTNTNTIKMKRSDFIKKTAIGGAKLISVPFILPSGRLFSLLVEVEWQIM